MLRSSIFHPPLAGAATLLFFTVVTFAQSNLGHNARTGTAHLEPIHKAVSDRHPEIETVDDLLAESEKTPNDPVVLNNLAVYYAAQGDLDAALDHSRRSVAANANVSETQMNLAAIYDRLKQLEKAHEHALRAAQLNPKNFRARSLLCELDHDAGRDRDAADCFQVVVADFPENKQAHAKYGVALMRSGEFAAAREVLERAHEREPLNLQVTNALGVVYFQAKEYQAAAAMLKEAVEAEPDSGDLRFNLGVCYLALKNREAALGQYSLLKESHPELADMLYKLLFRRYVVNASRQY